MKFQTRALILLFLSAVALTAQNGPTARIGHAPVLSGRIEGSVHVLTAENIVLNGDALITGDLLVPGTPEVRLNGKVGYIGTQDGTGGELPAGFSVTLSGGATLGHVVRRTDAVALPLVSPPQPPAGTRNVMLDAAGQSPGDFSTLSGLTLGTNVGQIAVPAGAYGRFEAKSGSGFTLGVAGASTPAVYNFQGLELAPGSVLQLVGPVIVTLSGDFAPKTNVGVADQPGWLKLRLASGGLLLAGNVMAHGALEAPAGTLSLSGAAQFTGSVAAGRLEMNGRASLRVLILNQPPMVDLVVPAEGAVLPDNVDVAFFANAGDTDGSVARVEFYDGAIRLGETTASAADGPVFRYAARLAAGPHTIKARAIDNEGAATDSVGRTITIQVGPLTLPITADFEPAEGYQPGPLHGQKGWAATDGVKVVAAPNGESRQEVTIAVGSLPESLIGRFAAPGTTPVFVDFLARPAAGTEPATSVVFATASARVALVGGAPVARLHAARADANGNILWQNTGAGVPVDAAAKAVNWLRLSVREDYGAKKWDLYADGRMIAADLAFTNPGIGAFDWFTTVGHPTVAVAFDNFHAGPENPIAADADRDGMDDAWETAHGLNPTVNDRNSDPDGDGLSNVQEYVSGTDPSRSDTDGDGLPDGWEVANGTNPVSNDATADLDHDGLTNVQEFKAGTNPNSADTDGDGLPDGWELANGTSPTDNDSDADPDSDGLTTLQEYQRGTNPFLPDTDRDGIKDGDEVAQGTDPTEYYNGRVPVIEVLIGDNQQAKPDTPTPRPLVVVVRDTQGNPLPFAPVRFATVDGSVRLMTNRGNVPVSSVTVQASNTGEASNSELFVFARAPTQIGQRVEITATAGATVFRFSCTAVSDVPPPPPLDFQAVENANNTVTYTWSGSPGPAQSMVLRMQNADGTWRDVAEIPVAQLPVPDAQGRYTVTLPRP